MARGRIPGPQTSAHVYGPRLMNQSFNLVAFEICLTENYSKSSTVHSQPDDQSNSASNERSGKGVEENVNITQIGDGVNTSPTEPRENGQYPDGRGIMCFLM